MFKRFKIGVLSFALAALSVLSSYTPVAQAQAFQGGPSYFAGSFTGTLTGYASPPTGTVQYRVEGRRVLVFVTAAITGTSNATSFTMTGLPFGIQPSQNQQVPCFLTDNTVVVIASCNVVANSSTVTFAMGAGFLTTGFTASGTKALQAGANFSYNLY